MSDWSYRINTVLAACHATTRRVVWLKRWNKNTKVGYWEDRGW